MYLMPEILRNASQQSSVVPHLTQYRQQKYIITAAETVFDSFRLEECVADPDAGRGNAASQTHDRLKKSCESLLSS